MELGDLDRADAMLTQLLADLPDLRAGWLLREDLAELRELAERRVEVVAEILAYAEELTKDRADLLSPLAGAEDFAAVARIAQRFRESINPRVARPVETEGAASPRGLSRTTASSATAVRTVVSARLRPSSPASLAVKIRTERIGASGAKR